MARTCQSTTTDTGSSFTVVTQKLCKILSVISTYPQHAAVLEVNDHATPAPEVPDPPTTDAVVDSPAVEDQCASDFNLIDVGVFHGPSEQGHWAESNRQSLALVHDRQVMERWGKQADEQANATTDVNARSLADNPGEDKTQESGPVEDQAERSLLRMRVPVHGHHRLPYFDFRIDMTGSLLTVW
jgi:hypothetical protein